MPADTRKRAALCAEPDHIVACPLPTHALRNGHLNQIAYSLYLFIRDVAESYLVGTFFTCAAFARISAKRLFQNEPNRLPVHARRFHSWGDQNKK